MSLNEYYGIRLDNEQWIKLGVKDTLEGTLSNENGVIMKFAAIKDQAHWNYKPEAQYMWNFFKNYQRDIQTGELIRVDKNNNDKITNMVFAEQRLLTMCAERKKIKINEIIK